MRPFTRPLIVALDVADLAVAEQLARRLAGEVGLFKVGLELFSRHGPVAVERIRAYGPVFLDLKLHDIPTVIGRAARQLGPLGVAMLTVHATGGGAMIEAAVEGLAAGTPPGVAPPLLLAVTVLTSLADDDLDRLGLLPIREQVPRLARLAIAAGAGGIVCAPRDLGLVRSVVGPRPVLVTPGVRPAGSACDDHLRAATPEQAIAAGADFIVVGRPVTAAADPVTAVRTILAAVGSQ